MGKPISIGQRKLHPLNDGWFRPPPSFFHAPDAIERLAGPNGPLVAPVGAFLWPGDINVLVDAGVGPVDYGGHGLLVGGSLLNELGRAGVRPEEVHLLALSHLHPDHSGWLASADGDPTFTNAIVILGSNEWQHFMSEHPEQLDPHLAHALATLYSEGRVELVDGEKELAEGIRLVPAPGHTPGHSVFTVHDTEERMLLLGDSVFCPLQLTESDLDTISDLDGAMARRTRDTLARELERHDTRGVGCHFPGLTAGRLLGGDWSEDVD